MAAVSIHDSIVAREMINAAHSLERILMDADYDSLMQLINLLGQ